MELGPRASLTSLTSDVWKIPEGLEGLRGAHCFWIKAFSLQWWRESPSDFGGLWQLNGGSLKIPSKELCDNVKPNLFSSQEGRIQLCRSIAASRMRRQSWDLWSVGVCLKAALPVEGAWLGIGKNHHVVVEDYWAGQREGFEAWISVLESDWIQTKKIAKFLYMFFFLKLLQKKNNDIYNFYYPRQEFPTTEKSSQCQQ